MLLYSLEHLCLTSPALSFVTVRDVRVEGSRVSPGCCLWFLRVFFKSSFLQGVRVHGESVQSYTRTASSRVTLTRESHQTHSAKVYSWHCLPSRLHRTLSPKGTVLFNVTFAPPSLQTRHIHWQAEQIFSVFFLKRLYGYYSVANSADLSAHVQIFKNVQICADF